MPTIQEELSKVGEDMQIKIVLQRAKEYNWDILKDRGDKLNFSIMTEKGIMLQRTEYLNKIQKVKYWAVRTLDGILIKGEYADIISIFVDEVIKSKELKGPIGAGVN